MAGISSIVTRGFGSWGSVVDVPTRGFGIGASVTPSVPGMEWTTGRERFHWWAGRTNGRTQGEISVSTLAT
jgi:hypothetical protein